MQITHSGDDISASVKRRFMHTAWIANALAFLLLTGFSALTPQMGERLGLPPAATIWLASTLLFSRTVAFVIFWKWEGWHYRYRWLRWALWSAPMAVAVAFFSNEIPLVFGALVLFGFAAGLSYASSLYYSLAYGENKGEHGGIHEAILGVGIFGGPLLAGIVSQLDGGIAGAQWTIIILALICNVAGMILLAVIHRNKSSQNSAP